MAALLPLVSRDLLHGGAQLFGLLLGVFALGDPVYNLRARDDLIGWNVEQRSARLYNVLDAFVLGAVPPYKFYGTDAAHLWHRGGIPGVVCGPGGKQTTSANEGLEIDEMVKAAQIYALAIADICG